MKTVIPDIQQGMNVVGTDGRKIGTVAALYGGTPDRTGRTGEVDVQIERGLAFFRAVGAKKIVRDAEGLLSAAASQSS